MDNDKKVADYWGEFHNKESRPKLSWLESDVIARNVNKRVSGDSGKSFYDGLSGYSQTGSFRRALIVGCGAGQLERDLIRAKIIDQAVGIDISTKSIEKAQESAGIDSMGEKLNYKIFNLEGDDYSSLGNFDLVIVCMVAHHILKLDHFFSELNRIIEKKGIIVLNEYIGPNRFWHNDKTTALINKILNSISDEYKYNHLTQDGTLRTEYIRTPLSHFLAHDPSEAIRSEEIMKFLEKKFRVIENRPYGGQINHMLLTGIIENFKDTYSDKTILNLLTVFEEILEDADVINTDFTFVVARPLKNSFMDHIKSIFR
jgi:2-polyprenyl-3-methyl-5-hydroxy-6-metoxy-1,4-benzoquinol methylase